MEILVSRIRFFLTESVTSASFPLSLKKCLRKIIILFDTKTTSFALFASIFCNINSKKENDKKLIYPAGETATDLPKIILKFITLSNES